MATIGFKRVFGNPQIVHRPEAASQSFVAGDLVYLTNGDATIIATDTKIFGVACQKASGTSETAIAIDVIDSAGVFLCEMDVTSADSQVGEDYGLNVTSGSMSVDEGEATTVSVVVTDLMQPASSTTGKVYVKFISTILQTESG